MYVCKYVPMSAASYINNMPMYFDEDKYAYMQVCI